jgi:hypothetical protein
LTLNLTILTSIEGLNDLPFDSNLGQKSVTSTISPLILGQ